jgi:uncharacterized membrane protein
MFLRLIIYYLFRKKKGTHMKTFIVIMATVILGVLIWGLILGPGDNSLYSQASRLLNHGIEQLQTIP